MGAVQFQQPQPGFPGQAQRQMQPGNFPNQQHNYPGSAQLQQPPNFQPEIQSGQRMQQGTHIPIPNQPQQSFSGNVPSTQVQQPQLPPQPAPEPVLQPPPSSQGPGSHQPLSQQQIPQGSSPAIPNAVLTAGFL